MTDLPPRLHAASLTVAKQANMLAIIMSKLHADIFLYSIMCNNTNT